MRKILFILNYRAGTNLWGLLNGRKEVPFVASLKTRAIVGGTSLVNPDAFDPPASISDWEGSKHSFFLSTSPPKTCPCENCLAAGQSVENSLSTNPPFDFFAWHTQIGDWWGEARSCEVPEPYEVKTPVRYGPEELKNLPGDDWRFIYIVRDGRNQIESLLNIPGGIEQDKWNEDSVDYFEVLCKGFRNRARLALDCQDQLPNFRMFRFEDFASDCVGILKEMYSFSGLQLDEGFAQKAYEMTVATKIQQYHSSFGSGKNILSRWKTWQPWQKKTFALIAGNELVQLGYEL